MLAGDRGLGAFPSELPTGVPSVLQAWQVASPRTGNLEMKGEIAMPFMTEAQKPHTVASEVSYWSHAASPEAGYQGVRVTGVHLGSSNHKMLHSSTPAMN